MIRIGRLQEAKPGDEITGELAGHLYIMSIKHMVYSTFDVDDEVEKYMRENGLTEPSLVNNLEDNGLGKWQFDEVSTGMVLVIGDRKELYWKGTLGHGYMHLNHMVMIHTPEVKGKT